MTKISSSVLDFLHQLDANNNRDWFNENKSSYQLAHQEVIDFAEELLIRLKAHDQIVTNSGKKSLMRIYRDVRFSKDKRPYKTNFAGSFTRQKPQLRGGYFFSLQPGQTVVGGGFYGPEPADLKLIRDHIAQDDSELRAVLADDAFVNTFAGLRGEQLKTAPKGFEKDHPSIDLLRYKSMYVFHEFTDQEVLADDFIEQALGVLLALRPFFDVMTEYLTSDLNGISLID